MSLSRMYEANPKFLNPCLEQRARGCASRLEGLRNESQD